MFLHHLTLYLDLFLNNSDTEHLCDIHTHLQQMYQFHSSTLPLPEILNCVDDLHNEALKFLRQSTHTEAVQRLETYVKEAF